MPECSCSDLPMPSGQTTTPPSGECHSIRMFFGSEPATTNGVPGQLTKLYYHDPIDSDAIKKGFKINNYSAKPLIDAGILSEQFPSTFTLTETELLSTSSFDSWVIYAADSAAFAPPNSDRPFGYLCMYDLNIDMDKFRTEAARMWVSLQNGDAGVFLSSLYRSILGPPKNTSIRYENSETNNCDDIKEKIANEQLMVCYNWIKTIADTYYGKQFLVRVAGPKQENQTFPGICIKDEDGNSPSFQLPFYIEGDGSSQGYYTSDEIADGGFPKQCSKNILGLTKIDWVQNSDGKISSFVKIGKLSSTNYVNCAPLHDRKLYRKFYDHEDKCVYWSIDLAKLDPNNYYIETTDNTDTLYIQCSVENRYYVDDNGTWVNIVLSEKVPLAPADINPILAIRDFFYLLSTAAQEKLYRFLDQFSTSSTPLAGTRSSISQLNLATALRPCLIPEGAVIPFKSNVYRYGPYFHVSNPDDGGGVDLVIEENIAPWNFIKPGDSSFPDDYPYCAMDKFGKELAKFTTKGLQKLEKGRITAVGLPCYNIGDSANTIGYDPTKEVGPTLLTDISVDYGSGGFNTTYNFSTYSPRLGRSEKYLREAWSQNLERTKYINSYLRSEREKVNNIKKDYTKQLLDKNYFFSPHIPKHKSSTPNRIVFSGYYLSDNIEINEPSSYSFDYNMPTDIECSESDNTELDTPLYPTPSSIRRYAFAESDKGYTIEHLQKSYFQLAGMSFDGFYLPVSLRGVHSDPDVKELINQNINSEWKNQARLPRFAMRCVENNGNIEFKEWDNDSQLDIKSDPGYPIVSKNRDEIPPFKLIENSSSTGCYTLPIHQKYLNPYVSESILETWPSDERKNESVTGFVISSIVFGQDFIDYQIAHTNNNDADSNIGLSVDKTDEAIRQKYNNFRIPSLRGPLVLQGWGYDTSGKPIPNAADNYINAEYGQFKKNGLTDKFLRDWLENPKTWPVGPVDLRFDRERGVWTCPSPNKIVVARLKENLCKNGVAKAQLLNPEVDGIRFYEKYHISGPQGENIKLSMDKTEISVYDFLGENIKKCSKVYVYFDDNRYIVLRSEPPETVVRFRHIKLCENSSEEQPQNYYGVETWGAYAGYGDKYYNYHTYGIRIDCDGNAIDIDGQPADPGITFDLTFIKNNAENWLIKLQDNAGKFGPSFGKFVDYEQWKNEASTGYATLINTNDDVQCEDSSIDQCYLGDAAECQLDSEIEKKIFSYDILFIESYARFVECELTQDLYVSEEESSQFEDDEYKAQNLNGNASANILEFYGDSPNGREPKFLKEGGESIPFRVFDSFIDAPEDVNPFIKLKYGDRVLAVFNEKLKKYIIWQSIRKEDKVVKFALTNDKQIFDVSATGVLVDQWSRPIDKKGNLITEQENFNGNFIIITDPYANRSQFAPLPNGNLGPNQTAFGPALGSDILDEHYNGIPLMALGGSSGSEYEETMPPFIGFALQRLLKNESDIETTVYEMFSLEHYARYIYGKICTKTASFNINNPASHGCGTNNNYYLGTVHPTAGFRDGLKPLARQTGNLPRGNIAIYHPLDNGLKPAIAGDLKENANDSSWNNIDGCEFIALLDSCASSSQNLIYNIIETTRFALEGKITLKTQYDIADELNNGQLNLTDDLDLMETTWYQGWMWDRVDSTNNFNLVKIFNREEWTDRGLFIKGSVITVYLSGIDNNGNPQYSVDNGGTIARTVQRYISNDDPGLFGLPNGIPNNDRKVLASDDFIDGLDPSDIDNDNKPIIDMSDDQQWMTYEQGIVTGLWDETLDSEGKVKNCKYKIIYAQEAPVIITGKAYTEFTPENIGAVVQINTDDMLYPSCQGVDRNPIPDPILQKVENPMGHGAKEGDWVTVQRVFTGIASPEKANYKYIVIGTGHPPGDLK